MAKSLRSKSRQRTLSVRRKKFRERERLKAWDHYHKINAGKETSMQTEETASTGEVVQEKFSKKEIGKWASRNSKKRQRKRLKAQAMRDRKKRSMKKDSKHSRRNQVEKMQME